MWIETNTMIGISQISKDFNDLIIMMKKYGSAIIMKNNTPVYIAFPPNDFDKDNMPSINIREVSRNLSKLTYILYDAGCAVVTRNNKPIVVLYDFNIIKNSNMGNIQIIKGGIKC